MISFRFQSPRLLGKCREALMGNKVFNHAHGLRHMFIVLVWLGSLGGAP
jgi:hypothetical protein